MLVRALIALALTPHWTAPLQLATGEAHRGEWQANASDFRYLDDATVHLNGEDATVAWVDQSRKDVFLQRIAPSGTAAAVNVSHSPATFSWLPRVIAAGDDIFVVWQEIIFSGGTHGGEILFARSSDKGKTLTAPVNLSNSKEGDGKGRLTAKEWHNGSLAFARSDGALYVAWTTYEGALFLRASRDGGATFEPALRLGEGFARAPALAARKGVVFLAWALGESESGDIQLARSTDAGHTFSAPRTVHKTAAFSDAPSIALDDAGTLHMVHGERPAIHYTRIRDNVIEPPRTLDDNGFFPQVAVSGTKVFVLWEEYPSGGAYSEGLAFRISRDGGGTFASTGAVPSITGPSLGFNGSQQGLSRRLAIAGDEIAIANSTFLAGKKSRIWLLRGKLP